MKKNVILMLFAIVLSVVVSSCKEEKKELATSVSETVEVKTYQPKHQSKVVDLSSKETYVYVNAPTKHKARSVTVDYDPKIPYAKPIVIKYSYGNGDTYTYTVPKDFGLWKNQNGKFRVITDDECTVWVQGQIRNGKFKELIFYGNPENNGKKIKPNSYYNLPVGLIRYCK